MADNRNVLVYLECVDGKAAPINKEILGCGRKLAYEMGEELYAVLVGGDVAQMAGDTIALGADKVYIVEDPLLRDFRTEPYLTCIAKVVEETNPRFFILGQTSTGLDLAPRLAFRFDTTLVPDCVSLTIDPESKALLRTKPVYGGKAMAVFRDKLFPQMATIRSKSMPPSERDDSRKGEIFEIDVTLDEDSVRTRVLEKIVEEKEGVQIEDADIVIAGGRGIGGPDGFEKLRELSKLLEGSAVGASRPPCDEGWVPATMQVGLSGKIIAPDLYITVGISGASQHMTGCAGSGSIIAINKDENALIFKQAKFGVVGDWKVVLPAFMEKLKELTM